LRNLISQPDFRAIQVIGLALETPTQCQAPESFSSSV
jgi:hypothetical protein